jgi:hypothetical protein
MKGVRMSIVMYFPEAKGLGPSTEIRKTNAESETTSRHQKI